LSQGFLQVVVKGGNEDGGIGEEKEDEQFWWFTMHYTSVLAKSLRKLQYNVELYTLKLEKTLKPNSISHFALQKHLVPKISVLYIMIDYGFVHFKFTRIVPKNFNAKD
jgi:hypothetical protein